MGDKTNTKAAEGNNNLSVMLDSKFLDCHICRKPLDIPVYQCATSHFVCSECTFDKGRKCTCSGKLIKCTLLGAVIQSVKIWCPYFTFGCREIIIYAEKLAHENSCPFNPNCFCPMKNCDFKCTPDLLSSHFKSKHSDCCVNAKYGIEFVCNVPYKFKFQGVIGEDGRTFLLLTDSYCNGYRSDLTLVCMGLKSTADDLCYEFSAALGTDSEDTNWSMKSSQIICTRRLTPYIFRKTKSVFLCPKVHVGTEELRLKICISKKCDPQSQQSCPGATTSSSDSSQKVVLRRSEVIK